jgi:hypothetical protein
MKKLILKIMLATALTVNLAAFVSCREKNTGDVHHSESGEMNESEDRTSSQGEGTMEPDSTPTGTDNSMPAQSSDTVGNNQGSTSPAPGRP